MELHAVQLARLVSHAGYWRRGVAGDHLETRRQAGDLVAVAHPNVEQAMPFAVGAVLDVLEQRRVAAGPYFGIPELAHLAALYLTAELRGHGLHAVADGEDRHSEVEHHLRSARRSALVDRGRPAGQDDSARRVFAHEL